MKVLGSLGFIITATNDQLKAKLGEANKSIAETNKTMKTASNDIANGLSSVSPAAGQAVSGLNQMSVAGRALKAVFSPIGLIIGIIATAVGALTAYFRKSVEGQQKMALIMAYLGGIMDAFKDVLIDVGKFLVSAFENPQQAVKDLWEVIKNNLVNRVYGLVNMFTSGFDVISKGAQGVGLAIIGIFSEKAKGQARQMFKEMSDGLIDLSKATIQMVTGITDLDDKLLNAGKKLSADVAKRAKENMALQARENSLKLEQIKNMTAIAKLDAEISAKRLMANDGQEDLNTRIEAQVKAMDLVNQKYVLQEKMAKQALAIQRERMALGHNAIEDLEKEAQLAAELINLEQQRDNGQRELLERYNGLLNMQKALATAEQQAIEDKVIAQIEAYKLEDDARAKILEDIRQAGLTEVQRAKENMAAMLEAHAWNEEEKANITKYWLDQIAGMEVERITALQEAYLSFGESVMEAGINASEGMEGFGKTVLKIAKQNIAAYLAESVAGAVKNALSSVPFPFNIAAASIAGGAAAALFNSMIPKMAGGGVIPPGYPNDSYPALLSSGETVTPPGKLPAGKDNMYFESRIYAQDILVSLRRL